MNIIDELEQVRKLDPQGILRTEVAVEFARDPKTELHKHLDWNDKTAGHAFRMEQMRRLIQVKVRLIDRGDGEQIPIRAFVSIPDNSGVSGYQDTRVVLEKPSKRRALIEATLNRIASLLKSQQLPEFDEIAQAIENCRRRYVAGNARAGAGDKKARQARLGKARSGEARPR